MMSFDCKQKSVIIPEGKVEGWIKRCNPPVLQTPNRVTDDGTEKFSVINPFSAISDSNRALARDYGRVMAEMEAPNH